MVARTEVPIVTRGIVRCWGLGNTDVEFASSKLRRRTLRISPFQQKRDDGSDYNEAPNQNGVDVDHAQPCEQESDASDQK